MRASSYGWCLALLGGTVVLSVLVGAESISPVEIGKMLLARLGGGAVTGSSDETILFGLRLPNTALIALIGATLGGSGAAYQGLFRNPLADPYIIGVAPGAALGAVVAMTLLGPSRLLGIAAVPAAAFLGALLTVFLACAVARVGKTTPVTTLILAGVAMGAFTSSLTWFLILQTHVDVERAIVFMLGGFRQLGWAPVLAALPYSLLGLVVILLLGRSINVLQFGDEQARQMGLDVEKVKLTLILAATLAAASAVAFAGIIGFVGLVVPHVVRLLWGPDYRSLVPLSILAGAATLLAADTLSRGLPGFRGLQVGVITALIGVPFFLWLLRREKSRYW
ncbi:MAG TPA: iron ABC transporter permease [Planctomycetota bacterium]|nr:iron ABC transporter permease [Planctomycetota bacterium]